MKNYTITVNGNVYDVTVDEGAAGAAVAAPQAQAPKAAPAPKKAAPAGAAGAAAVAALPVSLLNTADGTDWAPPMALLMLLRRSLALLLSKPVATTVTRISSDRFSSNAVPQMMFASG